ncbi:MAG: hemerythrin [Melioribacteraceae bacterium]|nr:MAG: hemerythrin [Melioribacteraceae bacterium]
MNFIEWSDELMVNVPVIDQQHKNMADILNALYQTLGSGNEMKAKLLMKDLVEDVKIHFETEEDLMKNNKYLNFFSHKLEHDRFVKKAEELNEQVQSGKLQVNLEMMKSFKNWFYNHIDINDKKMGDYLVLKGVADESVGEKVKS